MKALRKRMSKIESKSAAEAEKDEVQLRVVVLDGVNGDTRPAVQVVNE